MLLDRGLLERRDGQMVTTGEVESLEIPPTLHALAAARLDALGEHERRLVQDAAVLGKTFQVTALAAVSGLTVETLEPVVGALARKEIFSLEVDPWSPDQGQYGFVQELLRTVAYDTLSRRDRKARHVATARHLESLPGADEVIEVIAAHLLRAYSAVPDDSDDTRARARDTVLGAAQRASSLAAQSEATRLVLQAVELTDSDRERAESAATSRPARPLRRVGGRERGAGRSGHRPARGRRRPAGGRVLPRGSGRDAVPDAAHRRGPHGDGGRLRGHARRGAATTRSSRRSQPSSDGCAGSWTAPMTRSSPSTTRSRSLRPWDWAPCSPTRSTPRRCCS